MSVPFTLEAATFTPTKPARWNSWNLRIEQGVVNLDQMQVHLELLADDGGLVFAAAPENPTWTWDNEVEVHLDAVTADGKGLMASASTVVAADNTLSVSLSTDFPAGTMRPQTAHSKPACTSP